MRAVIEYDMATGMMHDANGALVGTWAGLKPFPMEGGESDSKVEKVVALKNAGFTTDDILTLTKEGVV